MSDTQSAPTYPADRETDIVLRDGSTIHVRPVRADDEEAIRQFLAGLSPESIGFRFFGVPDMNWVVNWSLDVDYADRFALIAETGTPSQIVSHASYVRINAERAEVAFLVADAWQGRGISTVMLAHLAAVATHHGIATFTAEVLPANHKMIDVFRQSGFPLRTRSTRDAIEVEFPTSLSPEAVERFEERERTAAVAAVGRFLTPRTVAVIGASRRRGTIGGEVLHNLVTGGFSGAVYAVNPQADVVQSLPAYRSIGDIPAAVDLAVVVVPAEHVVDVARESAAAGVRALLVISAGFGETGAEGAARQRELVAVCRRSGMRLIGPNCMGVINTAPDVALNATFAPRQAAPGRVGFLSQSGGVGIAIIEAASRLGVGLSSFVSVGNKADLSGNDFLEYWEQDPDTDVALLYLESFGNPRKFARVARRFARHKPIVAVKSGRSAAGARATSSHTGALLSASDVTIDALFHQAGVIRTDTLHELFDVAALLAKQPIPKGDRIAIITNGGGPGIICADACQADDVQVPELPEPVREQLRRALPGAASVANPVDLIASASAEDYATAMRTLIAADACDAIVTIFVPPLVTQAHDVAAAIAQVAQEAGDCTIASVFMTREGTPPELARGRVEVPSFRFPEDAARAIALAARHGVWRGAPEGSYFDAGGCRRDEAAAILSEELAAGSGWMRPDRVAQLLDCYGLPLITTRVVADAQAAVTAARELGRPIAMKAQATGLVHKSDAGGVRLALEGEDAIRAAAADIAASVAEAGHELQALVVQPMVPPGVELIVGVVHDQSFGPVLACGAGGTTAELIKDVAVRITPVTDLDAAEMVRSLRTFPLLDGYRGAPRCDIAAVEDVLQRLSAMVGEHPEIAELDCNPLVAGPDGATIVDARVRVAAAEPAAPVPSLG
ncbi:MAG TPA: GNAT family N-acetyltransferase, partial [Solirubrobacteraceae bacterium]|nr:GNAT family N-acetyltransferase [Solirubrobacteraceae bacterium]